MRRSSFRWLVGTGGVLVLMLGAASALHGESRRAVARVAGELATSATYSGRAFGASATAPAVGTLTVSDTDELKPTGGFRSTALLSTRGTPLQGLVDADVLVANTSGAECRADSSASLADLVVLPGSAAQVTASFVRAESHAACEGVSGTSEIADLMFAGQHIAVSGAPNQTITVPGVATLIINEQRIVESGTYHEITVNALHLMVPGVADIIVSSAKSDINCPGPCPEGPCHDFVTGGGFLRTGSTRQNFGFNAGFRAGDNEPRVHFNYIDHGAGIHVQATSITLYEEGPTPTSRRFEGSCTIDGMSGFTYSITVADNGEPGRNDTLSISLSNGYSAEGALAGGNIQLHQPCK